MKTKTGLNISGKRVGPITIPLKSKISKNQLQNKFSFQCLIEAIQTLPEKRNSKQTDIILQSLIQNKFFQDIHYNDEILKQIMEEIEIKNILLSQKIDLKQNQIILILRGQASKYIQTFSKKNTSVTQRSRLKCEYILMKKLKQNQYISTHLPQTKYHYEKIEQYRLILQNKCVVAIIKQSLYQRFFRKQFDNYLIQMYNFLKKFDIIRDLKKTLIYEIIKNCQSISYNSNDIIYAQGDQSEYLYFIRNGIVQLKAENNIIKQKIKSKKKLKISIPNEYGKQTNLKYIDLGSGNVFGVDGVVLNYNNQYRQYTAESITNTQLYRIDKRTLIILITSFYDNKNSIQLKLKEINLSEQVGYKFLQKQQKEILAENVRRIKSSQKKVQNIKLRGYESTDKKKSIFQNQFVNQFVDHEFSDYVISMIKHKRQNTYSNVNLQKEENYQGLRSYQSDIKQRQQKSANYLGEAYENQTLTSNNINGFHSGHQINSQQKIRIHSSQSHFNYKTISHSVKLNFQQDQRKKYQQLQEKILSQKLLNLRNPPNVLTDYKYRRTIQSNLNFMTKRPASHFLFKKNSQKQKQEIILIKD